MTALSAAELRYLPEKEKVDRKAVLIGEEGPAAGDVGVAPHEIRGLHWHEVRPKRATLG